LVTHGSSQEWDASLYQSVCSFVPGHGESLLEELNPRNSDRVLDFGCGTGELTNQIHRYAGEIVGIDPSEEMIAQARREFPECSFICTSARDYQPDPRFSAVFSNAVLHWVDNLPETISHIYRFLNSGGRFIGEFGAHGNVSRVREALHQALLDRGYSPKNRDPWTFPKEREFDEMLWNTGFQVDSLETFDRPTKIEGKEGLSVWLTMFGQSFFEPLSGAEIQEIIGEITEALRPDYFDGNNWTLEYRRLRFRAIRS